MSAVPEVEKPALEPEDLAGSWGTRVRKGLKRTCWKLQNSHRNVKSSVGSIVSNTVINVYGAQDLCGNHLVGYWYVNV